MTGEIYENFLIREINQEDIETLIKLDREIFGEDAFDKFTFEYLVQKCEFFKVVEFKKRIVGYICGCIKNATGYLASIALSKEFRGIGLGRYLLNSFENYVFKSGAKEIVLEVAEDNMRAINFYIKMGYKIAGKLNKYYPSGKNALRMVKKNF